MENGESDEGEAEMKKGYWYNQPLSVLSRLAGELAYTQKRLCIRDMPVVQEHLAKAAEEIEKATKAAEAELKIIQPMPIGPRFSNETVCEKCGMKFDGVMGYICPNNDCPKFLGGPTA